MAKQTSGKGAKASRARKREAGHVFNGDEGGVHLKRDTTVNLGDVLPDPSSDFVLLEDDDWIEDDK
jgi:hypothetical protein